MRNRESCAQKAFPRTTTKLRLFYEKDFSEQITQYVVRMPTVQEAKTLEARLTYCGSKAYAPSTSYTYRTLGDYDVENGLLVRARIFKQSGLPRTISLDAVGRDGRYVMWLDWAFQTDGKVPAYVWTKLSKQALSQLWP